MIRFFDVSEVTLETLAAEVSRDDPDLKEFTDDLTSVNYTVTCFAANGDVCAFRVLADVPGEIIPDDLEDWGKVDKFYDEYYERENLENREFRLAMQDLLELIRKHYGKN